METSRPRRRPTSSFSSSMRNMSAMRSKSLSSPNSSGMQTPYIHPMAAASTAREQSVTASFLRPCSSTTHSSASALRK